MNGFSGEVIDIKVKITGEFQEERNQWKPFSWEMSDLLPAETILAHLKQYEDSNKYRNVSLCVSEIIQMPWTKVSKGMLGSVLSQLNTQ